MKLKKYIIIIFLILAVSFCGAALNACGGNGEEETKITVTWYLTAESTTPTIIGVVDGQLSYTSVPKRENYTFLGLFDAPTGGTQIVNEKGESNIKFTKSIVLYAQWTGTPCKIKLDTGEGVLSAAEKTLNLAYGDTLSQFPIPSCADDMVFLGWADSEGVLCTDEDGNALSTKTVFTTSKYVIEKTTCTLYAKYAVKTLTVTLNFNNSAYQNEIREFVYGDFLDISTLPNKDTGKSIIASWSMSKSSNIAINTTITSDLTIYAVWKNYRIISLYDTPQSTPREFKVYQNETFSLSEIQRDGYLSDGWYESTLFSGAPVSYISYESNVTKLYAKWSMETYTVQFVTNSSQTFPSLSYDVENQLTLPTAQKDNFTFLGWCKKADLSDTPSDFLPVGSFGNIKLYAKYIGNPFTLTLDANGGTLSASGATATVNYSSDFKISVPAREGYTFLGWFDSAEAEATKFTDNKGNSITVYDFLEDKTLYAHWEVIRYTLTFNTNGGSAIPNTTFEHGETGTAPSIPTKTGQVFSGWFSDKDLTTEYFFTTKITANLTLYAKWIESTAISTAAELIAIANSPAKNYHLTSNINLKGELWTPIPEFSGLLNGNGFKIYNFTMSETNQYTKFGFISINNGIIKNLTFEDVILTNTTLKDNISVAIICGKSSGKILNCTLNNAKINSTHNSSRWYDYTVGLLCGENDGEIANCTVNGTLTVTNNTTSQGHYQNADSFCRIGGAVGINRAVIKNTISNCDITFKNNAFYSHNPGAGPCIATGNGYVGGFVGTNESNGECYNSGSTGNVFAGLVKNIEGSARVYNNAGGFACTNSGIIRQCFASGTVSGTSTSSLFGGFVANNSLEVSDSYASGEVFCTDSKTNSIGGFVAVNNSGSIKNCYASGNISGGNGGKSGAFCAYSKSAALITKCFATGNLTAFNSTKEFFITTVEGLINLCYYDKSATFKVNGTVVTGITNNYAEGKTRNELCREDFLTESLYWEIDIWLINNTDLPKLQWQS